MFSSPFPPEVAPKTKSTHAPPRHVPEERRIRDQQTNNTKMTLAVQRASTKAIPGDSCSYKPPQEPPPQQDLFTTPCFYRCCRFLKNPHLNKFHYRSTQSCFSKDATSISFQKQDRHNKTPQQQQQPVHQPAWRGKRRGTARAPRLAPPCAPAAAEPRAPERPSLRRTLPARCP